MDKKDRVKLELTAMWIRDVSGGSKYKPYISNLKNYELKQFVEDNHEKAEIKSKERIARFPVLTKYWKQRRTLSQMREQSNNDLQISSGKSS